MQQETDMNRFHFSQFSSFTNYLMGEIKRHINADVFRSEAVQ